MVSFVRSHICLLAFLLSGCMSVYGPESKREPEATTLSQALLAKTYIELSLASDLSGTQISETSLVRSIAEALQGRRIIDGYSLDRPPDNEHASIVFTLNGFYNDHAGENTAKAAFAGVTMGYGMLVAKFHESILLSASFTFSGEGGNLACKDAVSEEYHFRTNSIRLRQHRKDWISQSEQHFSLLVADVIESAVRTGSCAA
jgi:hypothetical protein